MTGMYRLLALSAAIVVGVDQATKELALSNLGDGPVDLIEGVITFRLTFNSGGVFGLGKGLPGLFLAATLVVLVGVLAAARRVTERSWAVPLGMVLGGGLGNVFDRLFRGDGGRVVDFIDLHVWPIFNVADASIVIAVVTMLFLGVKKQEEAT